MAYAGSCRLMTTTGSDSTVHAIISVYYQGACYTCFMVKAKVSGQCVHVYILKLFDY